MSGPAAHVVADSISERGIRLTTMEVRLHRFVLAELNTHRVFSRNSASSRALPVAKQIQGVREDPAVPIEFGTKRAGMQSGPPLTGASLAEARHVWLKARDEAVAAADALLALGVHKQVANRLLEPFMWHTVIVSATEWEGFFGQRCSPLAQPEIRVAAEAMRTALESSTPVHCGSGGWHLPYIRPDDTEAAGDDAQLLCQISAARCGRVSYLTHDGRRDLAADLALYQRFVTAHPARVAARTRGHTGRPPRWRRPRKPAGLDPTPSSRPRLTALLRRLAAGTADRGTRASATSGLLPTP